jgi:hypothetical protein
MPGLAGRGVLAKPTVSADWNTYVASLSPTIWLKLDENTRTGTAADSSGNSRDFSYPNGTYAPSDIPDRGNSPLVTGSTYSITTFGGGNGELDSGTSSTAATHIRTLVSAGSFTIGGFVQSTSTTGVAFQWNIGTYRCALGFNFDHVPFTTQSGTLSFLYDNTGTQANSLVVTGTGWNDGTVRPLFFEYDSTADTVSIWLGGTEIGTQARAGTKPTAANLAGSPFVFKDASGLTGLAMDELLFFDKTLTGSEHSTIDSYAV